MIDKSLFSAKKTYKLLREQITIVKKYIDNMLRKSFVKSSILFYIASILVVKQSNSDLRVCVDYRTFNALTIKNRNLSLLVKKTLVRLYRVKIYNKFDIIVAFNEIRIKEKYKKKIVFLIRYSLFIVILFELYNASNIFQFFINKTLREYLDNFCIAYFDNILIYSDILKKYIEYIKKVLIKLKKTKLYLDINKYDFSVIQVKYLDFIVTTNNIIIDFIKIETILRLKASKSIKNVQDFLDFANFYYRFVVVYSKIVELLTTLTKNNNKHFLFL